MSVDTSQVLSDLYPLLGAQGAGDLIWWTTDELYAWFDEAARRMARSVAVFVDRDTSITTALNVGEYALPGNHIATVQADMAGTVLRPATAQEIEALDATWTATVGTPKRFTQQGQASAKSIVLYPAPDAGSISRPSSVGLSVGLIIHKWPPQVASGNPVVAAPSCVREYFFFAGLGEARAKETRAAMPEVAQWARGMVDTFDQILMHYWGPAQ